MTSVKGSPHVAVLLGRVMSAIHEDFGTDDWEGLRQSHFRMLSHVPADGVRLTDLADELRMSKQGCGQFVVGLVDRGLVSVEAEPSDRRVRVVRRTAAGDEVVARVDAAFARLERRWRRTVGAADYETFRRVLWAVGADDD